MAPPQGPQIKLPGPPSPTAMMAEFQQATSGLMKPSAEDLMIFGITLLVGLGGALVTAVSMVITRKIAEE